MELRPARDRIDDWHDALVYPALNTVRLLLAVGIDASVRRMNSRRERETRRCSRNHGNEIWIAPAFVKHTDCFARRGSRFSRSCPGENEAESGNAVARGRHWAECDD